MIKSIITWISKWLGSLFSTPPPPYRLRFVNGDDLPERIEPNELVIAKEEDTLWTAGMICPCGCSKKLELMLLPDVKPRWDFYQERDGAPTLHPSVWLKSGCRSHFWLRAGRIHWC